ncbi:MAG: DNA recombination protein RmuC [Bacteroidota bacterium]|nr:DNA recombination protein RmuC [Bacteroidota bacterium]
MIQNELLYLLLGLIIGGSAIFFILRYQKHFGYKAFEEKIQGLNEVLEKKEQILREKESEILELNRSLSGKESDLRHLSEKLLEQKSDLEKIQEKFRNEFKNLANEILEEKTKKFTEQNSIRLGEILNPLNQKIKEFEKKVENTYEKEMQQRLSLKEEVKRLAELNQKVSKEANNLAKALKGDSKTQGDWGEVILESILERSGLAKNSQYFIQPSYTAESGKRLQPDVVVTYPGERSVVIDSKVSLVAYERFSSANDEKDRKNASKEHLISIKNHIKELSEKNYPDIYELKAMDFVMMFLPVEPAYYLAMQEDPGLWNFAYDKRILIISPTNLIAALKMVESMWRQENQNKNVIEIARQSASLYDKFVGLYNDLKDLGKRLASTTDFYTSAMNKLSEGKGSLVSKVENIKKLGVKTKKSLPEEDLKKSGELDD